MIRYPGQRELSPIERFAERCTQWVGSSASLLVHTILFVLFFILGFAGVSWTALLLVLTTVVSLEAIYLSIFIQISINRNTRSLEEVEENIDEIQENVGDIEESLEEIQFDADEPLDEVLPVVIVSKAPEPITIIENLEITQKSLEDIGDMQNIK